MRSTVGWVAVMGIAAWAGGVEAQGPEPSSATPGVISRADDLDRTCEQLAAEAATLSETMGATDEPTLFGRLGGLARTGAQLLPGGALVVAGADVVTGPGQERREAQSDAVRYRWHYLNGMYLGRGCEPPPAAAPAGSVAPSPPSPPVSPPADTPSAGHGFATGPGDRGADGARDDPAGARDDPAPEPDGPPGAFLPQRGDSHERQQDRNRQP